MHVGMLLRMGNCIAVFLLGFLELNSPELEALEGWLETLAAEYGVNERICGPEGDGTRPFMAPMDAVEEGMNCFPAVHPDCTGTYLGADLEAYNSQA